MEDRVIREDIARDVPCYPELVAIILAGLLHVAAEILVSQTVARVLNVVIVLGFLVYFAWRVIRSKAVLRAWGMRADNFWVAIRALSIFVVPAAAVVYGWGWLTGRAHLSPGFWLVLMVYPAWGIAQQFALQNLIARNLRGLLRHPVIHALVASALFGASHFPKYQLMALTFAAGLVFTLVYRRFPNLWAVGVSHGLLGAMVYYLVLGEDPGEDIIKFLSPFWS